MTGTRLQSTARRTAGSLRGVSHGRPFVEKLDVYKAGDKVFLIVTDDPEEQIITVKADPERGQMLRKRFPSVTDGRYLDKHHWVSIGTGRGVTPELVTELVHDSYDLVRQGVPRQRRKKTPARV
ncbi:MmcQ/YjbR family DNA-binding protein [Nocardia gamkensis]|uniref:MmcQ/YjbR family DNA-binding protein n=1 Tax=Nocardia gamkensis TaxID=352869 RepID=A0A7X6L8W2_9NOCA|nr:MmcQ/YjbR family DNA-binding protein [Nocardia gamkensis]